MQDQSSVQWLDAELSALPLVPAPESLQRRVLAELALRQAQPWWRKSFHCWPFAAQWGFVVLALGLLHLMLGWLFAPVSEALAAALRRGGLVALHGMQAIAAGAAITGRVGRLLLAALPTIWSMVLMMTFFSSVVVLFTSGTLVHRTLTRNPE